VAHVRHIYEKQPPDLLRDCRKCLLRRRPGGDERGYAPQRRLLLGQPGDPGATLRIRDRRRDELRERGEARLRVRRQRLLLARAGAHHGWPRVEPAPIAPNMGVSWPCGDRRDRAVGLVAAQVREIHAKQLPNLLVDRREHLLRRYVVNVQTRSWRADRAAGVPGGAATMNAWS
jgi:hypothetical protein